MPLDHRDFHQIARQIGAFVAIHRSDIKGQMRCDDLARQDPDHRGFHLVAAGAEMVCFDPRGLHRMAGDWGDGLAGGKGGFSHLDPARIDR